MPIIRTWIIALPPEFFLCVVQMKKKVASIVDRIPLLFLIECRAACDLLRVSLAHLQTATYKAPHLA